MISTILVALMTILLALVGFAGYNIAIKRSDYILETGVMIIIITLLIDAVT